MLPCVGVPQLHIQPLCKYHELSDGTYSLGDVERFHITIQTLIDKLTPAT